MGKQLSRSLIQRHPGHRLPGLRDERRCRIINDRGIRQPQNVRKVRVARVGGRERHRNYDEDGYRDELDYFVRCAHEHTAYLPCCTGQLKASWAKTHPARW